MVLFWNLPEKLNERLGTIYGRMQELRDAVESLREEKERYVKRYKAEKQRRSKLSREKQEAEQKIGELKQKLEEAKGEEDEEKSDEEIVDVSEKSIEEVKSILEKLESLSSSELDCVTIYNTSGEIPDDKGLKNTLSRQDYNFVSELNGIFFMEPEFIQLSLETRDFFESEWGTGGKFETERLRNFIENRKNWAVVSAGETILVKEESGEILEREEINSRVDSQQKKGGFSQDRFERKREEQIEEHLEKVEEKITEGTLLVGEERLCRKLSGEYLGGSDEKKNLVDSLYNFRIAQMKDV